MKEKITFDSGVKEYIINDGGALRFNPSDPNVYSRFKQFGSYLSDLEKEVAEKSKDISDGGEAVDILAEYDAKVKEKLAYVFGKSNDFNDILGGVNVMAVASNGELVVTNFLNGIRPIIEKGVKAYAKMEAKKAVEAARAGA